MKLVRPLVPDSYTLLCNFSVVGKQPVSFKNRQRIIRAGKFPRIVKSKDALAFEKHFIENVPEELTTAKFGALDDPLALYAMLYYANRRSDMHVEIIQDCLEKSGVIKNDRYLREAHVLAGLAQEGEEPRIEVYLYKINSVNMGHFFKEEHVSF